MPAIAGYARSGVRNVWLVDPIARTLEVLRLEREKYMVMATFADDARVRAEPFDAPSSSISRSSGPTFSSDLAARRRRR